MATLICDSVSSLREMNQDVPPALPIFPEDQLPSAFGHAGHDRPGRGLSIRKSDPVVVNCEHQPLRSSAHVDGCGARARMAAHIAQALQHDKEHMLDVRCGAIEIGLYGHSCCVS